MPRFKEKPVFLETMVKPVYNFDDQVQLFFSQSEAGRQSARSSLARIASRQIDREPAVTEANYTRQRKATVWYYEDKERHLEQLQSTDVPLLVVHGDEDLACAVKNWYALDPKPKTMDMVVFHDANHGLHHQYPVRSATIVKDFLADIR